MADEQDSERAEPLLTDKAFETVQPQPNPGVFQPAGHADRACQAVSAEIGLSHPDVDLDAGTLMFGKFMHDDLMSTSTPRPSGTIPAAIVSHREPIRAGAGSGHPQRARAGSQRAMET
ncbi:hypothetical protein ACWD0G_29725, partial [Streptomyces goshikiensis]